MSAEKRGIEDIHVMINLEKQSEIKKRDLSDETNKEQLLSPKENDPKDKVGPCCGTQKVEAYMAMDQEAQADDSLNGPGKDNLMDLDKNNTIEIPEVLSGVSDRLKNLLNKNTPLKEKIENNVEHFIESNEYKGDKMDGESSKRGGRLEKSQIQVKSLKFGGEKRITCSQSKKLRRSEDNDESFSSLDNSSSYLLGSEGYEQRIEDMGAKCGFHRRKGRRNSEGKGNKERGFNGNHESFVS
ncbi:hypothetical protein L1887_13984 [Cichorium endivia]|nr:hypothetical protein L1887_13984 [Cichorium endivia]